MTPAGRLRCKFSTTRLCFLLGLCYLVSVHSFRQYSSQREYIENLESRSARHAAQAVSSIRHAFDLVQKDCLNIQSSEQVSGTTLDEQNPACKIIADMSSENLMETLNRAVLGSEITHNIVTNGNWSHPLGDTGNITQLASLPYFMTGWMAGVANLTSKPATCALIAAGSGAEIEMFGLQPFTEASNFGGVWGWPASMDEAMQRPIYGLLNLERESFNPIYGDLAIVFSRRGSSHSPEQGVFLAPSDSGEVMEICDSHWRAEACAQWTKSKRQGCVWDCAWDDATDSCRPSPRTNSLSCNGWYELKQEALGTAQHWQHVMLANVRSWNISGQPLSLDQKLKMILQRQLTAQPSVDTTIGSLREFIEANFLGVASFPQDAYMLVGSFSALYGTDIGQIAVDWARRNGWAFAWGLGPLPTPSNPFQPDLHTFPTQPRLVDVRAGLNGGQPCLTRQVPGHKVHRDECANVEGLGFVQDSTWEQVKLHRARPEAAQQQYIQNAWQELVNAAAATQPSAAGTSMKPSAGVALVYPVGFEGCGLMEGNCFGVSNTGHCVCLGSS